MVHPDVELRFVKDEVGHGVFAVKPILRGALVWVRDQFDRVFRLDALGDFPAFGREVLWKYSARDAKGDYILFWDLARCINHSCRPSSLVLGTDFSIAVRDIQAGEELTEDYGRLNLVAEESFDCHCGEAGCRRRITPADARTLAPAWDAAIAGALRDLDQVPQPLGSLLCPEFRERAFARYGLASPP